MARSLDKERRWTSVQLDELMRAMVDEGRSLKSICDARGMSYWDAHRAIDAIPTMRASYARALHCYINGRVGDLDRIAEETPDVARARLMSDNIKWTASKLARDTYGDTVRHEVAGGIDLRAAIDAGQRRVDARLGRTIDIESGDVSRPMCDSLPAPQAQLIDLQGESVIRATDSESVPDPLDALRIPPTGDGIPW